MFVVETTSADETDVRPFASKQAATIWADGGALIFFGRQPDFIRVYRVPGFRGPAFSIRAVRAGEADLVRLEER